MKRSIVTLVDNVEISDLHDWQRVDWLRDMDVHQEKMAAKLDECKFYMTSDFDFISAVLIFWTSNRS
jgi:hypothetical protein